LFAVCENLTQGLKETGKLEIKALITRNTGKQQDKENFSFQRRAKLCLVFENAQVGDITTWRFIAVKEKFLSPESRHVVTSPTCANAISQLSHIFRVMLMTKRRKCRAR